MNVGRIKEMMVSIEKRLERLEEEETYLRYSHGDMEQLLKDVESGKVELQ